MVYDVSLGRISSVAVSLGLPVGNLLTTTLGAPWDTPLDFQKVGAAIAAIMRDTSGE